MNIGLVAMSGIRVCDEELLKLGLTLPGFVERSKTIASLPSLGLLTLAGMTPSRHSVNYIEVPDIGNLNKLPDGFDLIAISSYSAQISEAYELAQRYRQVNIPTIIGGPHVTAMPEEAGQYCDAVVVGEGERCWEQVLEDVERGKLQKCYGNSNGGFDLSDAPMPAFELLDISRYNRLTLQTSRGCPHRCDFCASSVMLTSTYQQKPVDKVRAEIDKILRLWEKPFLEFADDNSMVNKSYWKELLASLKGKRIKWFAETDLSVADDEELLTLMQETGCAQVLIGFESPVEAALQGIEIKNDWKYKKFSHYKEAINVIQSHGITVNGCFILGLDGQTDDTFDQVFNFVKDSGLYEVQVTLLTPFPGTPLYERLKGKTGCWSPPTGKNVPCSTSISNLQPCRCSSFMRGSNGWPLNCTAKMLQIGGDVILWMRSENIPSRRRPSMSPAREKYYRAVFIVSAIYDISLGIIFTFFAAAAFNLLGIREKFPPFQGYLTLIGAFLLVIGIGYGLIFFGDLKRNRDLISVGTLYKFAYCASAFYYFAVGNVPHVVFVSVFGVIDLIFFVLMLECRIFLRRSSS